MFKRAGCRSVVAVGHGTVMDCAKGIKCLVDSSKVTVAGLDSLGKNKLFTSYILGGVDFYVLM